MGRTLIFLSLLSLPAASQVLQTPQFHPGYMKLINTVDIYNTKDNFNNDGEIEGLADGDEFKNFTVELMARYGMSRRWELYGGIRYSNVKSISSQIQRTKSGFSDLLLGTHFQWIEGVFSLYPGALVTFPTVSNDLDTDDALLNEGSTLLGTPVYADYKLSFVALYGQLMPALLTDGRGIRAYYHLGAKKRFSSFIVNLELSGMTQLTDDEFADTPATRTDVVNRVNGGSLRYFSVNPSVMRVALQARMRISRSFIAGLGYATELNGTRHSSGSSIFTFLEYRIPKRLGIISTEYKGDVDYLDEPEETVYVDEEGVVIPRPQEETPPQVIHEENVDFGQGFEAGSEDVDQGYFLDADPSRPKVKKKKRKKRKSRKKKKRKKRRRVVEEEDWE